MRMITAFVAPVLRGALEKLKNLITENERLGKRTVIFCEDRLTLAAERTVCAAVGGTFNTSIYTFARFLAEERIKSENVLSSQGSAMAIRRIIEENRDKLTLFKRLNTATAAQDVYDTLALLYSSRIEPDDLSAADTSDPLLRGKLGDLEFLYRAYRDYLAENGCVDRNRYLGQLPDVIAAGDAIRGNDVIFLGFQSFTCSVTECARACMDVAKNVYGLFISGREDVYAKEAVASFTVAARDFGGCNTVNVGFGLNAVAEQLRRNIFNPEGFHLKASDRVSTDAVVLFEAVDEEEELEFVAARILRHVYDEGVRYRSISVMLSDVDGYRGAMERVFSEYGIPYYLDKRYSLSEHAICPFLTGWLSCAADGCTQESVASVISSPLFNVNRKDKDIFFNYALRLAAFRGGVKREPSAEILESFKFDASAVQRVREPFLKALKRFPKKAKGEEYCAALRATLVQFGVRETLGRQAEDFSSEYPSLAALSARAYDCAVAVVDEAEKITFGTEMTAREFSKILKSGFTAMQISLIPPKQDAVFVGELAATANTGSEVIFAVGLTDDVPAVSSDTSILTDRELCSLEKLNVVISPKITQVNRRARETVGLNLCAFEKMLYLTYPTQRGGEECCRSEIIAYAEALFSTSSGKTLTPLTVKELERSESEAVYHCSRPIPAIRQLLKPNTRSDLVSAIYAVLRDNGYGDLADGALAPEEDKGGISCGKQLYGSTLSPTLLESYFACPYRSFMLRGLRLAEREEGVMRPLDTGNFIHTVLQRLAYVLNETDSEDELKAKARALALDLLSAPQYSSLSANKRGEYIGSALVEEAVEVSLGTYGQLKNSLFRVIGAEKSCEIILDNGVKLFGRIDRVDGCGDMVRIIDYKTGAVDVSAASYYMGLKLQLPLYLLASSKGKRAVGAYYFPARVEYEDERSGLFRLKGFMDGSEDVVRSSDTQVKEKQKSAYVEAYLNGRSVDGVLDGEEFNDFLLYSTLVARKGAAELIGGNVSPSPAEEVCKSCSVYGSCGFTVGVDGEGRKAPGVNCRRIAQIVSKERGNGDE